MSKPADRPLRLRWSGEALEAWAEASPLPASELLVADSWLVDEGRMLGAALHRERFAAGARAAGAEPPVAFWDAALAALPRSGAWFPRAELLLEGAEHRFALLLREAPEASGPLLLRSWDGPDPRRQPTVKGPDLEALAALRPWARQQGADEAVLLDAAGRIIEGATTSLLWWREEALHAVPAEVPRIASVTERSLRTIASVTGTEVIEEHARPDELAGCELWAVNALHGIRVVRGWQLGGSEQPGSAQAGPSQGELELHAVPGRAAAWRARLSALRQSLPAAPGAG